MNEIAGIKAYVPQVGFFELVPFLVLLLGAIACLITDAATNKTQSRKFLPIICGASLLISMLSFFGNYLPAAPFIEKTFVADQFGQLGCLVILFASLVMTVMAPTLIERRNLPSGEFYTLILFASLGMVLLSVANELLTAFICLEMLSLSLYVLTGIDRRSGKAAEAAFKYFILGAFASAFLVFGIAFLFGATRTTFISEMAEVFRQGGVTIFSPVVREGGLVAQAATIEPLNHVWVLIGFALIFVGVCFKLSLAPFHMWAPDVYEGSNTPTTMVIATGSKVATFAFIVHLVQALSMWEAFERSAVFIVTLVAIASMIWGNLAALVQSNIKRMLAYSSIAHTGYAAIGLVVLVALPGAVSGAEFEAAQASVRDAIVFYLAAYTLMNVLAFGIAHYIGGEGQMGAWRGLIHRKPLAAIGMAVAMFSLLGIPPTVGFMGKFYIFKEAVAHGYVGLAVIGVLASVISAFYYLSLVVTMFMREEIREDEIGLAGIGSPAFRLVSGEALVRISLVGSFVLVFLFGVLPWLFFALRHAGTITG